MANNRIFLFHRSSGKAVFLGKRMGWGWYGVPDNIKNQIENLFKIVEEADYNTHDNGQDDFCIAIEHGEDASCALDEWKYGKKDKNGVIEIIEEDL